MTLESIDLSEYNQLQKIKLKTEHDMHRFSSYPFVSLLSKFDDLLPREQWLIRRIEDKNILRFFNSTRIAFGVGTQQEIDAFKKALTEEPLRSALIAAKFENVPNTMPKFIELAVKIILSSDEKGHYDSFDVTKVKIFGTIPSFPFSKRQTIADEWYREFIEFKLQGMKKVYIDLGAEYAYNFIVRSILHSIYYFAPYRYNIGNCVTYKQALNRISDIFINDN